jgi:hypothetical protein
MTHDDGRQDGRPGPRARPTSMGGSSDPVRIEEVLPLTSVDSSCAEVLELLPLLGDAPFAPRPATVGGGEPRKVHPLLAPGQEEYLRAHLSRCEPCADAERLLATARSARPEPPRDLGLRIVARALAQRETGQGASASPWPAPSSAPAPGVLPLRRRPPARWWTSSAAAAAVLVLAVGMGLVARGTGDGPESGSALLAALDEGAYGWWGDEWMVAGAPYLDGLSDETLAVLAAGIAP